MTAESFSFLANCWEIDIYWTSAQMKVSWYLKYRMDKFCLCISNLRQLLWRMLLSHHFEKWLQNTKVFITLALMVEMAASARILGVFMIDAFSHFNLNHAIMETLATAGHEITIISPFKPKILLANITYIQTRRESPGRDSSWTDIDLKSLSLWEIHEAWRAVLEEDCERFVSLNETKVSPPTLSLINWKIFIYLT